MFNPSSNKGTKRPVYFVVTKNGVAHSTWFDSKLAIRCRTILRKRGDKAECLSFIPKVVEPRLPTTKAAIRKSVAKKGQVTYTKRHAAA